MLNKEENEGETRARIYHQDGRLQVGRMVTIRLLASGAPAPRRQRERREAGREATSDSSVPRSLLRALQPSNVTPPCRAT